MIVEPSVHATHPGLFSWIDKAVASVHVAFTWRDKKKYIVSKRGKTGYQRASNRIE